jgi:hypothetical protein
MSQADTSCSEEYRDSSERPNLVGGADVEGTTPFHARDASASVFVLARLLLESEQDVDDVETEERKFIRRVFHFLGGDWKMHEI